MTRDAYPTTTGPDSNRFDAVDAAEDPHALVEFLDVAKAQPAIVAAKADLLARLDLPASSSALDVGCGYGADVVAMAERLKPGGHAVGIDASRTMIEEATSRLAGVGLDVRFEVADASALPFDDDAIDVCRVETVLQHLADPARAVGEMARVTRPGGRIGAIEFDLRTIFLDHPDHDLSETIRDSFVADAVQSAMGRQLPRLLTQAGLVDIETAAYTVLARPSFFHLLLGRHVAGLYERQVITPAQAEAWWSAVDVAAAAGHFTGGATLFAVSARSPR